MWKQKLLYLSTSELLPEGALGEQGAIAIGKEIHIAFRLDEMFIPQTQTGRQNSLRRWQFSNY